MKRTTLRTRGQMEILGIAIVVIILIIGVTFLLTMTLKPQERPHERFAKKQLAQNLIDAMTKSNTDCKGYTFATVLANCANRQPSGSIDCGSGQLTCAYARENIASILDEVLGTMNYQYQFTAKINGLHDIFGGSDPIQTERCTRELIESGYVNVETPGIQPFPIERGVLEIMLQICG